MNLGEAHGQPGNLGHQSTYRKANLLYLFFFFNFLTVGNSIINQTGCGEHILRGSACVLAQGRILSSCF